MTGHSTDRLPAAHATDRLSAAHDSAARAEAQARALLSGVVDPGDARAGALVRQRGALRLVELLSSPGAGDEPDRWARYRQRLAAAGPAGAQPALRRLAELGGRLLVPGDPGWPGQLDDLGDAAPLALWTVGAADLRLAVTRSVAVVGSRASTPYGEYVATEISAALAEQGVTVVSGGAYGIDAAAHRGALAVGGVSVCVLAGGVDVGMPAAHGVLLGRLQESGVVLAEQPPGTRPTRVSFLERNRLIAALTPGTVVVEAGYRSGALNTARHARSLNRVVMAVPGPVTSQMSAGTHQLLRDRSAELVTGAADIVELLTPLHQPELPLDADPPALNERLPPDHQERVRAVLNSTRGRTIDQVARAAGLSSVEATVALAGLELDGDARRGETARWRLSSGDRS